MKSVAALVGIVGLVISLVIIETAAAQTTAPAQQPPPATQSSPQPTLSQTQPASEPPPTGAQRQTEIDVASLVGSAVRAPDGKGIGEVQRVMASPKDGRITSLIVSIGGISVGGTLLGGGKTLSIPWESVKFGRDGDRLVVVLQQQILDQMPQTERDQKGNDRQPAASPPADQPKGRQ
jgi:sporulation protein YlmC with PRC-barrel domain